MYLLTPSEVKALVRRNLDELEPNNSLMAMYDDQNNDNQSIDNIIYRCIPDAINTVVLAAPVKLLEGEFVSIPTEDLLVDSDGVLSFSIDNTTPMLRLVSLRSDDSPVVVTDIIAEASPEGRKQLNKHIRGQYDRPRLVRLQEEVLNGLSVPVIGFKYYSLNPDGENFDYYQAGALNPIHLCIFKEQFYQQTPPLGWTGYNIPRMLRQNILDCVTAMVLEAYSDQRAQVFYQKANNF